MATRDDLKALIDQLPESRLEPVATMLEHHIHPRPPAPEIERLKRRFQDYKMLVERRFRETRKPGTIAGMTGGGSTGMHEGTPFGRLAFHYWDDRALVHQTLQSLDGQSSAAIPVSTCMSPDQLLMAEHGRALFARPVREPAAPRCFPQRRGAN
jgi:hypothetical protein